MQTTTASPPGAEGLPKPYDPSVDGERWCPLCQARACEPWPRYSHDGWSIVSCGTCQFVYLKNPVAYEALVETYAWERTSAAERQRRRRERPVLDGISRATRWRLRLPGSNKQTRYRRFFGNGKVLDIGCGGGRQLPEPIVPFGVELSRQLARDADALMRKRGGHCVHADAISGTRSFAESSFDGVLLSSFLEHEINPLQLLAEVRRVVSTNGHVYVRVPNFGSVNRRVMDSKWCGFRYPDHVNYFTAASLRQMAQRAGFRMRVLNAFTLAVDDNIKAALEPVEAPAA
ncbi:MULTISPECIES: class I SAM-dependent methyltransferase [unclassified Roseitalea]|uniref:class I SAM-dependent methyltransferase n=1 Tax=unclassified Roseitalea TaxID=2639107 RepID=UPI00273FFBC3|nr:MULTISPECIES: class I SAM-dependent methyltransferase [unclassified Roseitalea]